ncbi:hypothetical protein PoB_003004300 [Plakobranchus ocellatus]|uniref:Uncharacterized protein n=1 Tax=Plakobranchus ocellatus TaxID=259542 RepID=A0AAV4AA72_9GAST|nr:hypothetical protein PoB_003004300 [Plakobranchus ocellatus]
MQQVGQTFTPEGLGQLIKSVKKHIEQSRINQESLLPWLTSANSSSLTITGQQHGRDAFCAENRQVAGWAKRGQRSGRAVGTSSNLLVT